MKAYYLIVLLIVFAPLTGCGNPQTPGGVPKPTDPATLLIEKRMGIVLPADALVISLADNPQAFMFTVVTALTVQQAKDYFQNELTVKGYIPVPLQPNELAGGIMKYSMARDLVTIQVALISGKSNVSFERWFKKL